MSYVTVNCFYDPSHALEVRDSIYFNRGKGLLRSEAKGRVLEGGIDAGIFVGQMGVFCNEHCRDRFCGPRPRRTVADELDEIEKQRGK